MTSRGKLHRLVDELSEIQAGEALRIFAERCEYESRGTALGHALVAAHEQDEHIVPSNLARKAHTKEDRPSGPAVEDPARIKTILGLCPRSGASSG